MIIRPSRHEIITGMNFSSVVPHPDCFKSGTNILHQFKVDRFIELEDELKFVLSRGARICDVMKQTSITSSGLLVSEKFANFLNKKEKFR